MADLKSFHDLLNSLDELAGDPSLWEDRLFEGRLRGKLLALKRHLLDHNMVGLYNSTPLPAFSKAGLVEFFEVLQGFIIPEARHRLTPSRGPEVPLWEDLHPEIVSAARNRLEAGHFSDAVEAALKEINSKVKALVLGQAGAELDGARLMTRAFSLDNPILRLADLSTESGRSEQQGYMQIFAGAMTGIRNPKAHANITIDSNRAVHFLYLASLLMFKLDERVSPP
jgi:uncharacterized protein (TIGR02391 family)